MKVLKDVVVLEEGNTIIEYIVLRKNLEDFWNQVIATVEPKGNNDHIPVCAVGTPGIGKSLTTPILIRLLLKQKKKVIYRIRTIEKDGWVYFFIPKTSQNHSADTDDATNVHVILEKDFNVINFNDPSIYYIVDPGKKKMIVKYENSSTIEKLMKLEEVLLQIER